MFAVILVLSEEVGQQTSICRTVDHGMSMLVELFQGCMPSCRNIKCAPHSIQPVKDTILNMLYIFVNDMNTFTTAINEQGYDKQ